MFASEVNKMFNREVADKKRTASGVHHKTGKRGYVGKMRLPSDIMSRKDKYNYRKSGKVVVTKLAEETIISYQEFLNLTSDEQKKLLLRYRNKFTTNEITKAWNLSNATYYRYIKDFKLPKAKRKNKANTPKRTETKVDAYVIDEPAAPAATVQASVPEDIEGMGMYLKGTYSAEKLIKRLEKIGLILMDEETEFEVEIKIKEKN